MNNLDRYKLDMQPIPPELERAIKKGVEQAEFPAVAAAAVVFQRWDEFANRMLRAANGSVLVSCTTDMPGVAPAMIDWWFGWHLPASERYRLWHPLAHVGARVEQDRSSLAGDREKYLGNISFVDEYIGKQLMHLSIAFFDPAEISLEHVYAEGATVICARTSDRSLNADAGYLVHLVIPTATGSEMRSVFWLGQVRLQWPVIGKLLTPLLNSAAVRRRVVGDRMASDLMRHCAEEMNHLPRFLPQLYREQVGGPR